MQKLIVGVLLCTLIGVLAACGASDDSSATLPPGDPAKGEILFATSIKGAPVCKSCHTLDGTSSNGPSMQGYSARAGTRVDGEDAMTYTRTSITRPSAFIVSGFANIMYNQYRQLLDPQELSDLVAYLLTL